MFAKLCKLWKCNFLCFLSLVKSAQTHSHARTGESVAGSSYVTEPLVRRGGTPPPTRKQHTVSSQRGGGGGLTRDYLGKSGRNSILKLLICVLINLCCTLKLKGSLLENKNHEIVERVFILNSPDERNRILLTFYKKIAQKIRILKTYFNVFLKRLLKNKNITSHQFH